MITADEARKLDPSVERLATMEKLDVLIREAAEKGLRKIRVPFPLCNANGYHIEFKAPGVEDELIAHGFQVTPHSEERQFVDVWIEISWGA